MLVGHNLRQCPGAPAVGLCDVIGQFDSPAGAISHRFSIVSISPTVFDVLYYITLTVHQINTNKFQSCSIVFYYFSNKLVG